MQVVQIFWIVILVFSAVAHEVAHAYVAFRLGDPTARLAGRITLNPVKHLDPFGSILLPLLLVFSGAPLFAWAKPVPINPYNLRGRWGTAIVSAAGPLTNFALALVFGLTTRFVSMLVFVPIPLLHITTIVVLMNINLALFNLIPIPPLDGSKVLFAFLPYKYIYVRNFVERYGFVLLLLFIFFLSGVLMPVTSFLFMLIVGSDLSGVL